MEMTRRVSALPFALVAGAFLWACAGNPGPGDAGYAYNLSGAYDGDIYVEGMSFATTLDLRTGPGGLLEGSYSVNNPVSMSGDIAGSLVADTVRFAMDYVNPMDGCGGTLNGTAVVEEGGNEFSGRARISDSCNGALSGSFSFGR